MATVLRGIDRVGEGAEPAARVASFTFSDMEQQGDDYVRRVREEAAKEVKQAKEAADRIRRNAESAGALAAKQQIDTLLDERLGEELKTLRPALDQAVAEIEESKGAWLAHWRDAAIRVAVAMAERIVRRELAGSPEIGQQWLTEALQLAAGSADITVRLAPDDFEALRNHATELAKTMGGVAEARFVADPTISLGGCRVETRHGVIDQQLETQLERLTEELG